MAKHEIEVHEGAAVADQASGDVATVDLVSYVVTAEAGLFKHGRLYKKGSRIDLPRSTGETFAAAGEVKESK